jgi:hypothetical protein
MSIVNYNEGAPSPLEMYEFFDAHGYALYSIWDLHTLPHQLLQYETMWVKTTSNLWAQWCTGFPQPKYFQTIEERRKYYEKYHKNHHRLQLEHLPRISHAQETNDDITQSTTSEPLIHEFQNGKFKMLTTTTTSTTSNEEETMKVVMQTDETPTNEDYKPIRQKLIEKTITTTIVTKIVTTIDEENF